VETGPTGARSLAFACEGGHWDGLAIEQFDAVAGLQRDDDHASAFLGCWGG